MQDLLFNFLSQYVSLNDEEKQALIDLDIFFTKKKGTVLLEEGQRSQDGYFVLKGCIRTYYVVNGEEKTTAFYTEMEGLTPHCVLDKKPSQYYVASIEDSILLIADSAMEAQMLEKFPKFETLCRKLSEELLAKSQINFDDFKLSSPEERYLNLTQKRPDLIQRVPQRYLASFLGITPQSLSRMRARILEKN